MADWKCRECGAPWAQRVFRQRKGIKWTQSWEIVKVDKAFNPHSTIIHLCDEGLCDRCREGRKHEATPNRA